MRKNPMKKRRRQKLVIPKHAPLFNADSAAKYARMSVEQDQPKKPISLSLPPPSLEPIPIVDPQWRPQPSNEPQALRPPPHLFQSQSRAVRDPPMPAKRRPTVRTPRSPARKQKIDQSTIRLRTAENFGKILGGDEYGNALEQRIWKAMDNGGRAYANKVREILYALKNNNEIKEKVMKGDISLKRLAKMSTEDLASSELARKRKQLQQEQLEQIIVKNKHFLGRRGDHMQLLGDRHDIDHEDPEFNRQVDTLDITLDTINNVSKRDSQAPGEPTTTISQIKISSPTSVTVPPAAPPDLPEVNVMQEVEDDEDNDSDSDDDQPLASSINPPKPPTPVPAMPAPAPPPAFSELLEMDLEEPPAEDAPMEDAEGGGDAEKPMSPLLEEEEGAEDGAEAEKMEEEQDEEEDEESDDDIRAPEPDFEKPPATAATKTSTNAKKRSSSRSKEELPGFLRSVNVRELPKTSDISSPPSSVKSPPSSFAEALNSPSPKPPMTSPNKRKRKSTDGGDSGKRKKQFKPSQLQWQGRLKDRSSKKTFDVKIEYLAGTQMYLKKFIPRTISTNGRIRYTNIDNVLPMLKKKSGSKSHLLFKLSNNAKDKSRRREYEKVFEEYENQGRGMVIDMKSEKGFKMYILPPIYDKEQCQIDRKLVQEIWGMDPPEGQPWGYLLYYSRSNRK